MGILDKPPHCQKPLLELQFYKGQQVYAFGESPADRYVGFGVEGA